MHRAKLLLAVPSRNHLTSFLNDLTLSERLVEIVPLVFEVFAEDLIDLVNRAVMIRGDHYAVDILVLGLDRLDRCQAIHSTLEFNVEETSCHAPALFHFSFN